MISKIALLILGLIAEKPLSPYEIMKLLEKMNVNDVFPMSDSSIYATIRALVKKGYIAGNKVANGNFPAKTIYNATKEGEAALQEAVERSLSTVQNNYSEFDVALSLICHLPKDEAIAALRRHRATTLAEIEKRAQRLEHHTKTKAIPYTGLIRRKHNILKFQAELKIIDQMIANMEKDRDWDHFPAFDVKI